MRVRLLLVDDDDVHRRSLALALRVEGFEVTEAKGAAEASVALANGLFELAIVDLILSGTSGLELARRIRDQYPNVGVVLTSAYHLTERQLELADVGAIGFVPKPYDVEELAEFLKAKAKRRSSRPPETSE